MTEIRDLTLLSSAQRALAEARTVDEAKDLRDKAVAVRPYVQKARLGQELVIEAATIRIRAERRLGQILHETTLAQASTGNQYTGSMPDTTTPTVSLKDLGITKNESSRSQRIAGLADDLFEAYLEECQQTQREPTLNALLRLSSKNAHGNGHVSTATTMDVPASQEDATADSAATVLLVLPSLSSEEPDLYQARIVDRLCRWNPGSMIRPDAHLYVWASSPQLPDALDIIDAWQFAYFGSMACVYQESLPDVPWPDAHHLLLLGTRGSLGIAEATSRSWLSCRRPSEGCIPDKVIDTIEMASPEPYLWLLGTPAAEPDGWSAAYDLGQPVSRT